MLTTVNSNTTLTENYPKEIEEKIGSLIAESLPYYKSIFKEMFLANQNNAMLLYYFLVTEKKRTQHKT